MALCGACRGQLSLADWPACRRCAARLPEVQGATLECNYCRGVRLRMDRTLAVGEYEGLLKSMIVRLKDDRSGVMGRTALELAWAQLGPTLKKLHIDVVTAVPMHAWRRWQRGVNPPRRLAEHLARRLHVPAAGAMMALTRNVRPQLGLTRKARLRNMVRQMRMRPGYHLSGAHVLVVDDILTTGATCSEAAQALKTAGAAEVTALVLARTPAGE